MTDAVQQHRESFGKSVAQIELVVSENAKGLVCRVYDISTDDFIWVYGNLRLSHGDRRIRALCLCGGETRVSWSLLKAALTEDMEKTLANMARNGYEA